MNNWWQETPVYIVQMNNLDRGFRRLIEWLKRAGMTSVTIIDNHSTYHPLLDYYSELSDVTLAFQSENLGQDAFWKLGWHLHQQGRFIVTDPDLVPDLKCPLDLVLKMHEVADRYPNAKVGPGLRIDNLPDHYDLKELMRRSEIGYWNEYNQIPSRDGFFARIDTTFALYEPCASKWDGTHIRLDFPYVVEHVPWYMDSNVPNDEREYYKTTAIPGISHSQ